MMRQASVGIFLVTLLVCSNAFTVPDAIYDFYLRVNSASNLTTNNPLSNLQVFYYGTDCVRIQGDESSVTANTDSPNWQANGDPLVLIGNVDSVSSVKCIKFEIWDINSEVNGQNNLIGRYVMNTLTYNNYFQNLGSVNSWIYQDPLNPNTTVSYSTKVTYTVNVNQIISDTTVQQRGAAAAIVLLSTLGISIAIAILEYFCLTDAETRKSHNGCTTAMLILRSTCWLFFGGLWTTLVYVLIGILLIVTVIGIPFGLKLMRLSVMILLPFDREMVDDELSASRFKLSFAANIVWILIGGAILAIVHLCCAIILIPTVLGIPFAMEQIKLARTALFPFGKTVVRLSQRKKFQFDHEALKKMDQRRQSNHEAGAQQEEIDLPKDAQNPSNNF